jgi:hypothetical protein
MKNEYTLKKYSSGMHYIMVENIVVNTFLNLLFGMLA